MAEIIISGGSGGGVASDEVTAVNANVLEGKTALTNDSNDEIGTGTLPKSSVLADNGGTMVNRGAVTQSLAINGEYTIPAGYHNGSGKVTQSITTKSAETFTASTSDQEISANQYLSGKQTIKAVSIEGVAGNILVNTSVKVKSNGQEITKIDGSMVNNGAVSGTLPINGTYTIPAGYHNGSGTVTQSIPVYDGTVS